MRRGRRPARAGGGKGDVVVDLDAGSGPARGRIVFEAKDPRVAQGVTRRARRGHGPALRPLRVWVVPSEEKLPAGVSDAGGRRRQALRGVRPRGGSRLGLEVAYTLARARVVMATGGDEGLDATWWRRGRARARRHGGRAADQEPAHRRRRPDRRGAKILGAMADRVRAHLARSTRWSPPRRTRTTARTNERRIAAELVRRRRDHRVVSAGQLAAGLPVLAIRRLDSSSDASPGDVHEM